MTRRPRILTVEQADAAMERLAWLRAQGSPNAAVRELWDCATALRAEIYRLQKLLGQDGDGKWQRKVNK
jgi:hypothetical protein